jgi:hypothetical protein
MGPQCELPTKQNTPRGSGRGALSAIPSANVRHRPKRSILPYQHRRPAIRSVLRASWRVRFVGRRHSWEVFHLSAGTNGQGRLRQVLDAAIGLDTANECRSSLRDYTVLSPQNDPYRLAHLRELGPLWITVYSGGKSLQSWFPCRHSDEQSLAEWFHGEAKPLGACSSTWGRSQFIRMPDADRNDGRRQSIEYCNPGILN